MNTKRQALEELLESFSKAPFKTHYYTDILVGGATVEDFEKLILEDGKFADLEDGIPAIMPALKRLANIAVKYHAVCGGSWDDEALKKRFFISVARYCKMEADRTEPKEGRFHDSIFRIPGNAINIFFAQLPEMKRTEAGEAEEHVAAAYREICRVAMQPWTLPKRFDKTDDNPISVERFSGHMWWITANGIGYRPLIHSAILFRNEKMMDVIAEVCARSLSPLSYNTQSDAFWSEGICADGFGWGHGRQTYNLGYPLHGLRAIFEILTTLKGTPWDYALERVNAGLIVKYIRAITFCEFKEFSSPMQTRSIFFRDSRALDKEYMKHARAAPNREAVAVSRSVLRLFGDRITDSERQELEQLCAVGSSLNMTEFSENYKGVRYFFNNDSLIRKTDDAYIYVNMASRRRDGAEFAAHMADKRNYFTADGSYVILRDGDEYRDTMGTWQVSDLPGITSRKLKNSELKTETNWHGYRSKHNFAAGATDADLGCAGFIFEKDDVREPDGAGKIFDDYSKEIMGVLAYKSYFLLGDTAICLGAGITDLRPELGKEIHTTVNNTQRKGEVTLLDDTGCVVNTVLSSREFALLKNMLYIKHGGVVYGIYPEGNNTVKLELEERMTNWYDLNETNRNAVNTALDVFELALYHGSRPTNGSYAYLMHSGNERELFDLGAPIILSNTKKVQAVSSSDGRTVAAIFYTSDAQLAVGDAEIKLGNPGSLLITYDEARDETRLTASDGEQNAERLCANITVKNRGGESVYSVDLPTEELCGKPATVTIKGKII